MKSKFHSLFCAFALLFGGRQAAAQGSAFTYQGRLNAGTNPANGTYTLTFAIYTNSSGGGSIAGPMTNTGVIVTNGLFTVMIDFGSSAFSGTINWLEIGVESNGDSTFTILTPRQQLTPAPYAIYAAHCRPLN